MTLDEQKEVVAKQSCLFVADQLESKKLNIADSMKLLNFLVSGFEGAGSEEDLKKLPGEVKQLYPTLPSFALGI